MLLTLVGLATASVASAGPPQANDRLTHLARLGTVRLTLMFEAGTAPAPGEIVGELDGLSVNPMGLPIPFSKSFTPAPDGSFKGIVRGGLIGLDMASFVARMGAALSGPGEALILDYDQAANVGPARLVIDEVRRVAPGEFVGRTFIRSNSGQLTPLMVFVMVAR